MGKKNKGRKQPKEEDEVIEETRFSAAETHPQFRPLKQKESKVVLDERFSSVLTDPRFQLEGRDKYGRKKKAKQNAKEELSSFYMVEEEKDEDTKDKTDSETSDSSDDEPVDKTEKESEEEKEDPASRIAYLTALSRGEVDASSSSGDEDSDELSDADDDDDDDEGENPVYGNAGVLDPSTKEGEEVEISYDSSPYLVVQNMDWLHIRAIDLFSLLSSFTSPGAVKRVQVFQSDFGMERMEKDRVHGPSDIWKKQKIKESTSSQLEDHSDDDDDDSDVDSQDSAMDENENKIDNVLDGSNFDPEKLRAYEASKLKYYFAIVEFAQPGQADIVYREVDGMEFERSSAAIDLRTLPVKAFDEVSKDRPLRDEATTIPSNYEPPEFVVSALQQTSIECTWDQGDAERERKLTKYGSSGWQDMMESDDMKAYLASDASSDDDSDDDQVDKSTKMRKLLGLDSDDEGGSGSDKAAESSDDDSDSEEEEEAMSKEIKYIPGKKNLEDKIRSKINSKDEVDEKLTPWQKYQEKRKQKRRERRQATRGRRNEDTDSAKNNRPTKANQSLESASDDDDFFIDKGIKGKEMTKSQAANTEELELLLAGDNDEEQERDFDIRGIQRMEKNKGKKLKGGRKRKEEKIAADVSGTGFKVDVEDSRFSAVLDGSDGRFGIDKTDPNYKDTSAMRDILAEQTKRRKKKRQKTKETTVAPNINAESEAKTTGSSALSSLVQRLKTRVSANNQQ
jgi:hypothetical protein